MQLTKQHKALVVVVVLGVGAVLTDQVVLQGGGSGPTKASAASALSAPGAGETPSEPAKTTDAGRQEPDQTMLADHAELASRLDAFAKQHGLDQTPISEAFAPPGAWAKIVPPAKTQQPPTEIAFQKQYRLEAVLATGQGRGVAVINGKTVRLGDRIQSFELVEVADNRAVFRQDGHEVVLTLEQDH